MDSPVPNVLTGNETLPYNSQPMIDPEIYNSLAIQFSLAQQRSDQAALVANKSRLSRGEEGDMRQELLIERLRQKNEARRSVIAQALEDGDAGMATAAVTRPFTVEPRMVVEEMAAEQGAAKKQIDQPEIEFQKTPEERLNGAIVASRALALSNAFTDLLAKIPEFNPDYDPRTVSGQLEGAKNRFSALSKYVGYIPELVLPLVYAFGKSEEGSTLLDTIAPGTASERTASNLLEPNISDEEFLRRLDKIMERAKIYTERNGAEGTFAQSNPLAAFVMLYESVFTGQGSAYSETVSPELQKLMDIKEFDVNGVKIPNILPELYSAKNTKTSFKDPYTGKEVEQSRLSLDPIFNSEWFQNASNFIDLYAVGRAAVKTVPLVAEIAGQRAAAKVAAEAAMRAMNNNTGSPEIGLALQLRKNELDVSSGVQEHIQVIEDIAQAGINNRVKAVRTSPLTGEIQELIDTELKPQYGKELHSMRYMREDSDQFIEVLIGKRKNGAPFTNRESAVKANERYGNIYEIEDLKPRGGEGFVLKAKRAVDENGWIKPDLANRLKAAEPKNVDFLGIGSIWGTKGIGDAGRWLATSWAGRYSFSPAVYSIWRTMKGSVSSAFERGKMLKTVEEMIRPVGSLNSGELDNLADIINYGKTLPSRSNPDELGKWFDYGELDRAYRKLFNRGVTEKEAKSYYSYRAVSDLAHDLLNESERSAMLADGNETWRIKGHVIDNVIGKKVKQKASVAADARVMLADGSIVRKDELAEGLLEDPKTELIKIYGLMDRNTEPYTHLLVRKGDATTGGLQRNVIGYTEGGTRNYYDVWFAKQLSANSAEGKKYARNPLVHGIFRTKQQAEKYVNEVNEAVAVYKDYKRKAQMLGRGKLKNVSLAQLQGETDSRLAGISDQFSIDWIEEEVDKGRLDLHYELQAVYDREKLKGQTGPNFERILTYQRQGKLYLSERGDFLLQDGEPARLANPYHALSQQISKVIHDNAYKNFAIQEVADWYTSFGHPSLGYYHVDGVAFPTPEEVVRHGKWVGPNKPETQRLRNMAEAQRMYVARVLGQPGEVDTWFAQMKSRYAQKLATVLGDKAWADKYDTLQTGKILTETNAIQALKTFAFDATLGFFHIGQIALQGMASLSAAVIHPVYGAKAISLYPLIRAAELSNSNIHVLRVLGKRIEKTLGIASDEFISIMSDYRRSGIHHVGVMDTILDRAQFDVGRAKFGPANMYDVVRKAGRIPLYEGERIGRIVAFQIARDVTKDAVRAGKFVEGSAEYIQEVQALTNKFTLNMMAGMETWWQRNTLASIPTQFWQYPWKYTEIFLGLNREFTDAERARFIIGHWFLFGSHAIPFGPEIVDKIIAPAWENMTDKGMELSQYMFAKEGPFSYILNQMTGQTMAFGSTYGSGGFGSRLISDIYSDATPLGFIGGLPFKVYKNLWDAGWDVLGNTLFAIQQYESLFDPSFPMTEESLKDLGTVFRGLSAYMQAFYLHRYGMLVDSKGSPIEQHSKYSVLAAAMGIKPEQQSIGWDVRKFSKAYDDNIKEVANEVGKLVFMAKIAAREGNEEKSRLYMRRASGFSKGLTFEENREMIKYAESIAERDYEKYLENNKEALPFQTGKLQ